MNREERAGPVAWAAIIATTCLLVVLLEHTLWLVLPFILGGVMYYILLEPMQRMVRAGVGRNVAASIVCSIFFTLVALALAGVFSWSIWPQGAWQALLNRYIDGGLAFIRTTMIALEFQFPILAGMQLQVAVDQHMKAFIDHFAQEYLGAILLTVAGWFPSLLLAPFLTFFFLRDDSRFKKFLARAVPNAYFEKTLFLLHEIDQTARRYFEGLIRLTVLDTAVLALGLWAIGVSSPLVLGLISALLAWVPFVGSVAGCVLVVVVGSTDAPGDPMIAYGAIGVFVLVRLLDDFVFMPLTLGRSLQIHPMVTVLMIFTGGVLAGVAGLMLVLPLLGVVMVVGETLARLLTNARLKARHRNAQALRAKQASVDLAA